MSTLYFWSIWCYFNGQFFCFSFKNKDISKWPQTFERKCIYNWKGNVDCSYFPVNLPFFVVGLYISAIQRGYFLTGYRANPYWYAVKVKPALCDFIVFIYDTSPTVQWALCSVVLKLMWYRSSISHLDVVLGHIWTGPWLMVHCFIMLHQPSNNWNRTILNAAEIGGLWVDTYWG